MSNCQEILESRNDETKGPRNGPKMKVKAQMFTFRARSSEWLDLISRKRTI